MLLPRLKLDAATRFELVSPKGLSLLQSAGYPILPRSDNKLVDLAILETANLLVEIGAGWDNRNPDFYLEKRHFTIKLILHEKGER